MRLKFTLDSCEKIKAFTTIIQMLAKHGKEATFTFDDEFLLILLDSRIPYIYIKIDMNLFTMSYIFLGADENYPTQNKIVFFINLKVFLSSLMVFYKGAERALFKLVRDPFVSIRIETEIKTLATKKTKATTAQYTTEIPIILVPTSLWTTYDVPKDLVFDAVMRAPRYAILRKYIEIYKKFKYIDCLLRKNTLQLLSDDENGNKVSSTFDNIKLYSKTESRRNRRTIAKVDSKKIASYMTSLNALSCIKITNLKFSIAHKKLLKISFRSSEDDLKFNFILPSKTESGYDTDESDEEQ